MKMTGDTPVMASPDVIDAVPGFRSIVLPTQATERSELEGQGAGLLTEHILHPFNASGRWVIKREQLPENVLFYPAI